MSAIIELEQPRFPVSDGFVELADREEDGKVLVLYVGDIALLHVIQKPSEEFSALHMLSLIAETKDALDLLYHPTLYATPEEAKNIFDPQH